MKTKGALIWELNQPWSVEEIEIGDPRCGEVKVELEVAGLCHSDLHLVTAGVPMAGFPVFGGHEGAGIVTEIGAGVEDLAVGDDVVLSFIPACGKCPSCQEGLRNLCDVGAGALLGTAVSDGTFRIQAHGQNVYPMALLGAFAPYVVVHHTSVVKIDPLDPVRGGLHRRLRSHHRVRLGDRSAEARPGEDVAIVGVGGVGVSALQGAVHAGARYIFAIDPMAWKRDQALKFGATHVYDSADAALAGIADVTGGAMARKVIVTVGEVHGEELEKWMLLTAKAGTCVLTAVGSMLDMQARVNLAMLTLMQKNLQGSIFGGANPYYDIPSLLSLYQMGKVNLDDMVTRRYRLEQINDGYRDMVEGRNIRGIIRYTDADRHPWAPQLQRA